MTSKSTIRLAGIATAVLAAPIAAALRFAHVYRRRAGHPRPQPPTSDPSDFGLVFEDRSVPTSDGLALPAWWIPAAGGGLAPAIVLVHGWESARHRTLPNAQFLHALGYHVLTLDVRGHGANAAETLPVSAGEFGADALAGVEAALADPSVTAVAVLGHSMGSVGAALAAAAEPRVAAVILTATPSDPYRMTRQTFRLAHIPLPDPIAYPLAWLTTRVFLRPRGRAPREISASAALGRYTGPVLAIHGTDDQIVPYRHLERLVAAGRTARATDPDAAPIEVLAIPDGRHSWLYEFPAYRGAIGRFLATALGGPLPPDQAALVAEGIDARRPVEPDHGFSALAPVAQSGIHGSNGASPGLGGGARPSTAAAANPSAVVGEGDA
ncbi:MAG: alpha/beta fold hydrolase [Chloroflexota bacterium]